MSRQYHTRIRYQPSWFRPTLPANTSPGDITRYIPGWIVKEGKYNTKDTFDELVANPDAFKTFLRHNPQLLRFWIYSDPSLKRTIADAIRPAVEGKALAMKWRITGSRFLPGGKVFVSVLIPVGLTASTIAAIVFFDVGSLGGDKVWGWELLVNLFGEAAAQTINGISALSINTEINGFYFIGLPLAALSSIKIMLMRHAQGLETGFGKRSGTLAFAALGATVVTTVMFFFSSGEPSWIRVFSTAVSYFLAIPGSMQGVSWLGQQLAKRVYNPAVRCFPRTHAWQTKERDDNALFAIVMSEFIRYLTTRNSELSGRPNATPIFSSKNITSEQLVEIWLQDSENDFQSGISHRKIEPAVRRDFKRPSITLRITIRVGSFIYYGLIRIANFIGLTPFIADTANDSAKLFGWTSLEEMGARLDYPLPTGRAIWAWMPGLISGPWCILYDTQAKASGKHLVSALTYVKDRIRAPKKPPRPVQRTLRESCVTYSVYTIFGLGMGTNIFWSYQSTNSTQQLMSEWVEMDLVNRTTIAEQLVSGAVISGTWLANLSPATFIMLALVLFLLSHCRDSEEKRAVVTASEDGLRVLQEGYDIGGSDMYSERQRVADEERDEHVGAARLLDEGAESERVFEL